MSDARREHSGRHHPIEWPEPGIVGVRLCERVSQSRATRAGLLLAACLTLACQPARTSSRDWAEVPLAGSAGPPQARLVDLVTNPAAYRGRSVRMSLRVVGAYRDPRGVWMRVVPAGAPMSSESVKFLIPKGIPGDEYIETAGRDLELVLRIERVTATMAYETAFEVTPVAYVSRFTSSSRGGEDAAVIRKEMERTSVGAAASGAP